MITAKTLAGGAAVCALTMGAAFLWGFAAWAGAWCALVVAARLYGALVD